MRIAVHVNRTLHSFPGPFNEELALSLATLYTEDELLLIYDDEKLMPGRLPENCIAVSMKPRIKNNLLLRYWYGFRIHKLLSRFKPDVFITAGDMVCPKTSVPQALIIHRNRSAEKNMRRFLLKHREKFSRTAAHCFLCGPEIRLNRKDEEIPFLKPGIDKEYHPREAASCEALRRELTSDNEFFLYMHHHESELSLITLLKSYSVFKKWQQSSTMLVILSEDKNMPQIDGFENYKYRNEVLLMSHPGKEKAAEIVAAAYAGITATAVPWNDPGLLMMASDVPVISVRCGQPDMLFGDAALPSACDETDLSRKMMQLYKNEELRRGLIRAGRELVKNHSWEDCARVVRTSLGHA